MRSMRSAVCPPPPSATLSFVYALFAKAASDATSNVYVSAVDPVLTPLRTVSVTGWSAFRICWLLFGVTGTGAVSVMPVAALVTDAGCADALRSLDGLDGLFSHAAAASVASSALQT